MSNINITNNGVNEAGNKDESLSPSRCSPRHTYADSLYTKLEAEKVG